MFKNTNVLLAVIFVAYILLISLLGIYLKDHHLFTDEQLKISDYITTVIAVATVFIGIVAAVLTYRSLQFARRAEEGQLYITMMERYSSKEMVDALKILGSFKIRNSANLLRGIEKWSTELDDGNENANTIDEARHKVKYFYRDLMQLFQANYFSREVTKRILNTGGRYLFNDVVLPMEKFRNQLEFESEFSPFHEIHSEINKDQKPVNNGPLKKICLIPARYDATRYPGKLMEPLGGKTVIRFTYDRVSSMGIFDRVAVVTNSEVIRDEILRNNGDVIYLPEVHQSGTDRIAAAARELDVDIIVNVQGDEPFVRKQPLLDLLKVLEKSRKNDVKVASLMRLMDDDTHIRSENYVKVIVDKDMNSLYFSRSVIPCRRNTEVQAEYFEHIGVYGFTKRALLQFSELEPTPLEKVESVECLRYLENGIPIKMVKTDFLILEIDTEEDRIRAERLLKEGEVLNED